MAKVTGPLMSMDASGSYAGTIVFTRWKGRNVVRQLVTPANPKSLNQETARNAIRVLGAGQRFANQTTQIRGGETITDKDELIGLAPSGQAWNGFLVKSAIGAGGISYDEATTAWNALLAADHTNWDNAAAGLVPAIPAVAQFGAGGAAAPALTAGEVYFHYEYGLYKAGAASMPTATPSGYM